MQKMTIIEMIMMMMKTMGEDNDRKILPEKCNHSMANGRTLFKD